MKKRICTNCKHSIEDDFGNSNYDVEGTLIYCSLNKNSSFPVDIFHDEPEAIFYAKKCKYFERGKNIHNNVDD